MIYGLLWLAFVGYLLSIRRTPPRVQAKYGALAGVALSAAAWFCHVTVFEPGPTPPSLKIGALGFFAFVTGWTLFALTRTLAQSNEALEQLSPIVSVPILLTTAFVWGAGLLGYPAEVAIGGGLLLFFLSVVIGRPRRGRHA
jgi:hypothetical protein